MKYFAMLTVTPFINTKGLVHPFQSGRATYWDFYYILVANSMMAVLNISMVAYSVIITTSLIHFIFVQTLLPYKVSCQECCLMPTYERTDVYTGFCVYSESE